MLSETVVCVARVMEDSIRHAGVFRDRIHTPMSMPLFPLDDTYVVNTTYQATNREEISLDQGSFVTVLEKSFTGWWIVR